MNVYKATLCPMLIKPAEVEEMTSKHVWIGGHELKRFDDEYGYFYTVKKAKQYLIDFLDEIIEHHKETIENLHGEIKYAKETIEAYHVVMKDYCKKKDELTKKY